MQENPNLFTYLGALTKFALQFIARSRGRRSGPPQPTQDFNGRSAQPLFWKRCLAQAVSRPAFFGLSEVRFELWCTISHITIVTDEFARVDLVCPAVSRFYLAVGSLEVWRLEVWESGVPEVWKSGGWKSGSLLAVFLAV